MSFAHSWIAQIWSSLLVTLLFFQVFLSGSSLVIFCKSTKFPFLSFSNIKYFTDLAADFSLIHISGSVLKSPITISFLFSCFSWLIYLSKILQLLFLFVVLFQH